MESLNVVKYISLGHIDGAVLPPIYTLPFERTKETFASGIVPTVANCAH